MLMGLSTDVVKYLVGLPLCYRNYVMFGFFPFDFLSDLTGVITVLYSIYYIFPYTIPKL